MVKCPTCAKSLSTLSGHKIQTHITYGAVVKSVVYKCPHIDCQAILGVGPDPAAFKEEIVSDLLKRLTKSN
jgi:hypothetical protein